MSILKTVLKYLFALFFVVAGVNHFVDEDFYMRLMPDYIPYTLHLPAVYVSGVCEILLGALLLVPRTQRLAAWGLIALLIAVFPANIYAYRHSQEIFPKLDPRIHLVRLPLQGVLIAWAYWYTRPERKKASAAQRATAPDTGAAGLPPIDGASPSTGTDA